VRLSKPIRVLLALLGLAALTCYAPLVDGYVYNRRFWFDTLQVEVWVPPEPLPLLCTIYLAARLGGRLGFLTAPLVMVASGVWYAYATVGAESKDFDEQLFYGCISAIPALAGGCLICLIREPLDRAFSWPWPRRNSPLLNPADSRDSGLPPPVDSGGQRPAANGAHRSAP
jgi:hypothetical protein